MAHADLQVGIIWKLRTHNFQIPEGVCLQNRPTRLMHPGAREIGRTCRRLHSRRKKRTAKRLERACQAKKAAMRKCRRIDPRGKGLYC
jgi:hypothetical protein